MDIKNILDTLGIDLTNPEAKRGAIEAIDAILSSRAFADVNGNGGGGGGLGGLKGEFDVELDPDLIQPSRKSPSQASPEDIEIEDEEDILSQIKHNQSDDSDDDSSNAPSEQGSSEEENGSKTSSDSSTETTDLDGVSDIEDAEESENSSSSDNDLDSDEDESTANSAKSTEASEINDANEEDAEATEDELEDEDYLDTEEESEESTSAPGEPSDIDTESSENDEATETDESDDELDDEDLLDDELKNAYDDEELKTKQNARKIKRERTLLAAAKALADAKARKAAPALIRELEQAMAALEALTEAVAKNIGEISDDEFNLLINRVFDAIDAVGDTSLTFSSEEERELQAQEIKADISSATTQNELSAEDIAQIRAEHQEIKAREKEADKYKPRAASSFKGFQDFLNSLYRAIALQVHSEEARNDTWSAINRRHSGTGVLQQGKRIEELPNKKIPVIDFYFDCSGSWTDQDLAVGEKAVSRLVEMEEAGQIKINIFYFSDDVFNDAASARAEGGTSGWNSIVKNVITTNATNVIIMTDSDMENWWRPQKQPPLKYTVPGYVWYLWRDGENAPRCPRDLKGRGGTQQFSFSTSDA